MKLRRGMNHGGIIGKRSKQRRVISRLWCAGFVETPVSVKKQTIGGNARDADSFGDANDSDKFFQRRR